MSNKVITVDEHLNSVIQAKSFDNFTVIQLRDAYIADIAVLASAVEVRKFVYRQVLRFLRLGILEKEEARNSRESKYYKPPKFHKTKFKTRTLNSSSQITIAPRENNNDAIMKIEELLKQYKIDLLASVGESEEYMRLYQSNPEFKALLETEYHQARDQSSKLLGKIKALKTVLTHYSN
ncbi:hypothetical protein [Aliikangiella sp. IMCC44359]|uniref:hypothetical protein n=1 Tax=Aliikangiella sp. IMCC44359 TaxID=3459125 RepID=UPI00403B3868